MVGRTVIGYDDFKFFTLQGDIKLHDQSKLSKAEFVPYRRKFFPTDFEKKEYSEIIDKEFKTAWEHHKLHNPHHWENWSEKIAKANPYQVACIVQNVCDWMAMGMKFDDTAQIYYEKNKDKIKIPKDAESFMYNIFEQTYEKVEE